MPKTALIIDDSPSIRELLKSTLTSAGFTVQTATDGAAGLALLGRTPVDLIMTDLNMPGMDGLTFVRAARGLNHARFTPILVLTTVATPEKKAEGREAGATGWLVKPFHPEQLLAVVNRLVA